MNNYGFLNSTLNNAVPYVTNSYTLPTNTLATSGSIDKYPFGNNNTPIIGKAAKSLNQDGINWFGKNGVIGNAAMGLEALSGLANAYTGYKAYKLAKQQFGFQKALANRNLMNQAKIINNTYDNAAQVASGMIGSRNADGTYGFTDPNVTKRYEDKARTQHVNGSAI